VEHRRGIEPDVQLLGTPMPVANEPHRDGVCPTGSLRPWQASRDVCQMRPRSDRVCDGSVEHAKRAFGKRALNLSIRRVTAETP